MLLFFPWVGFPGSKVPGLTSLLLLCFLFALLPLNGGRLQGIGNVNSFSLLFGTVWFLTCDLG